MFPGELHVCDDGVASMAASIPSDPLRATGECFATTRWSVVLLAGHPSAPEASAALEKLCRTYWYPVYAFVRWQGNRPEDAQDLTQEFFARLLSKNFFALADPEKGRFRSFLLSALKYFLADQRDKANAEKRGGGRAVFSLNDAQAEERYLEEPATDLTPERIFDRRWAMTLLDQALQLLRAEFSAAGKSRQFDLLRPFLAEETIASSYDPVAAELQTSPKTIAVAVFRLRGRYRELVRAEIAKTVAADTDVDNELRALFG